MQLGEHALLLEAKGEITVDEILQTSRLIEHLLGEDLQDIVPAYRSIAVFTAKEPALILNRFSAAKPKEPAPSTSQGQVVELPICYEEGLDLDGIANYTGLSPEEVIEKHLDSRYRFVLTGFMPGFIYADGLDLALACPRKETPRKRVPAGAVGIGGNQTGIYSISSPGGWNIIGRTPLTLFDSRRDPPLMMQQGDYYRFKRISKQAFDQWGK